MWPLYSKNCDQCCPPQIVSLCDRLGPVKDEDEDEDACGIDASKAPLAKVAQRWRSLVVPYSSRYKHAERHSALIFDKALAQCHAVIDASTSIDMMLCCMNRACKATQ
mmetsp:Transcript_99378/g.157203  ORF Transcript_99378/g.157203 Transcript_99378/m.157203 type:complete len:108 (+) Transcript_99378:243-566(+)